MNVDYNIQKAKELADKADYLEFEYIRTQEISEYITTHSNSLEIYDIDFLVSWLGHSNFSADEIIDMLYEEKENGE